jgi:fatty acid desaturase
MKQTQSITSIGVSPEDERKSRMLRYTLAMTIRVICIVLAMVVQGWLMWVFFAGAILLPYFAVVIANGIGTGHHKKDLPKAVAPTLQITADQFMNSKQTNE